MWIPVRSISALIPLAFQNRLFVRTSWANSIPAPPLDELLALYVETPSGGEWTYHVLKGKEKEMRVEPAAARNGQKAWTQKIGDEFIQEMQVRVDGTLGKYTETDVEMSSRRSRSSRTTGNRSASIRYWVSGCGSRQSLTGSRDFLPNGKRSVRAFWKRPRPKLVMSVRFMALNSGSSSGPVT